MNARTPNESTTKSTHPRGSTASASAVPEVTEKGRPGRPSEADIQRAISKRDLVVDLARVVCVLTVVVVHTLFVGVRETPNGFDIEKTVELQWWFNGVSWVFEIMPLFFVVGGFAAATAYRSALKKGRDAGDYLRGRILRLARPALPVFVFFAIALGTVKLMGIDPALVDGVAVGIGSPLWFLSSFLIAQSTVPLMVKLHESRPVTTFLTLVAASLIVDIVRWVLGGTAEYGFPNVLFVWVAVQQLGFFMHDGWFRNRRKIELIGIIVLAYATLWASVRFGGYSPNMLQNQYPPTVPLILLGIAQVSALELFRAPLEALMRTRPAQMLVWWVGSRAMTIYCWHMPVILLLVGVMILLPGTLTEPGTPQWWLERIPFVLAVLAIVGVLSIWLKRFEAAPPPIPEGKARPTMTRIAIAMAAFCVAPFLIMVFGLDVWLAVLGLVGTVACLWLLRPGPIAGIRRTNASVSV